MSDEHCIRCGRSGPNWKGDADASLWEVADDSDGSDGRLICPGCLTLEEHDEMAEDMARTGEAAYRLEAEDLVRAFASAYEHLSSASAEWPQGVAGQEDHGRHLLLCALDELADMVADGTRSAWRQLRELDPAVLRSALLLAVVELRRAGREYGGGAGGVGSDG